MRNSVLEGFRHRILVVIKDDSEIGGWYLWDWWLISGLWCYVYDLVHVGGSEGRKIWTIVCRQRRGDDRQRMRKLVCWVGRCKEWTEGVREQNLRNTTGEGLRIRCVTSDIDSERACMRWGTTWSMIGLFPRFQIETIGDGGVWCGQLVRKEDITRLEAFEMKVWRRMEKISWTEHIIIEWGVKTFRRREIIVNDNI